MILLVDENIPHAGDLFGRLGEVRTLPGRTITPTHLAGVQMLLVRSVTRIDDALLDGTPVRFVATATSGTDHVDQEALRRRGIEFASAPGSNAAGVADYVAVALVTLASRLGWERLAGRTIAVIGHGHVGPLVASRAHALGMRVLVNDPPLARSTANPLYRPLEEVLRAADVVSLHCSLSSGGLFPSFHLADERFFQRMRPGALFINASRGEVCDEKALWRAMESGRVREAVLDVWEDEPTPDARLLRRAALATPHIGGYSAEGKLRGAQMIYEAACRFLGREPETDLLQSLPAPQPLRIPRELNGAPPLQILKSILYSVYDIKVETTAMRLLSHLDEKVRGIAFDGLRRAHGPRREFSAHTVEGTGIPEILRRTLKGLGFKVE